MSKANSLGVGLQNEGPAKRFQIAEAQKKIQSKTTFAPPPFVAAPPLPKRSAIVFLPKMPGVSKPALKKELPGTRRKLVVKVNVKSPALRRALAIKA